MLRMVRLQNKKCSKAGRSDTVPAQRHCSSPEQYRYPPSTTSTDHSTTEINGY